MKKLIAVSIFLTGFFGATAQQDAMFSQYIFNGLILNPAYAGSHEYFSSSIHYRTQWMKYKGAPETGVLAMDLPFSDGKMGAGMIISNDRIGVTSRFDIFGNYAYHIKVSDNYKLSLGAKGGVSQHRATLSELEVWDQDEVFMQDVQSKWLPKFGMGAYFYGENLFAGISAPTLLAYDSDSDFSLNINESSRMRKHFFLSTGYVHFVNDFIRLRPSVLLKYVDNAPLQADFNFSALLKEMFWVGASYRTKDALAILLEYQANKYFRMGYAFDITVSRLRHYNSGTHELMIGVDLGRDIENFKPRLF